MKFRLRRLQAVEMKQNGQDNPWKCLEKKTPNLEMFGVDLAKFGGPGSLARGERRFHGRVAIPSPPRRELSNRKPYDTSGRRNDSSWPGLSRPSQGDCEAIVRTPRSCRFAIRKTAHSQALPEESNQPQRVDGRDKPGHDGSQHFWLLV
jgi:hypothetical protein